MVVSKQLIENTVSLDASTSLLTEPYKIPAYGDLIGLYFILQASVTPGTGGSIKSGATVLDLIEEIVVKEGSEEIYHAEAQTVGRHQAELLNYLIELVKFRGEAQRYVPTALASGTVADAFMIPFDHVAAERQLILKFSNLGYVIDSVASDTAITVTYSVYGVYAGTGTRLGFKTFAYTPSSLPTSGTTFDGYNYLPEDRNIIALGVMMDDDLIDYVELKPGAGVEKSKYPLKLLIDIENHNAESSLYAYADNSSSATKKYMYVPHKVGDIVIVPPAAPFRKTSTTEFKIKMAGTPTLMNILGLIGPG